MSLLHWSGAPGGAPGVAPGKLPHLLAFDVLSKVLPGFVKSAGVALVGLVADRARRRVERLRARLEGGKCERPKTGSIVLERDFERGGEHCDMFDALLAAVTDMKQSRRIRRTSTGVFLIEGDDVIQLGGQVAFRKLSETVKEGAVSAMRIEVFSLDRSVVELRAHLERMQEAYRSERNNCLGKAMYYFDEIPHSPRPALPAYGSAGRGRRRPAERPPTASGSRPRGSPTRWAFLLHGDPGCGKTSFIKALANETQRHIVNIIVMEDVDCLGASVVYQRQSGPPGEGRDAGAGGGDTGAAAAGDQDGDQDSAACPKKVTLSHLLNLLDGILETPGRILVMTSNHPEKLDAALIRPGRIDVDVRFGRFAAGDILDMARGLLDWPAERDLDDRRRELAAAIPDGAWTPAEAIRVLLEEADDPEAALRRLAREAPAPPPAEGGAPEAARGAAPRPPAAMTREEGAGAGAGAGAAPMGAEAAAMGAGAGTPASEGAGAPAAAEAEGAPAAAATGPPAAGPALDEPKQPPPNDSALDVVPYDDSMQFAAFP
eukprot:jgi/Tetstr1/449604/TSEL_036691.t1